MHRFSEHNSADLERFTHGLNIRTHLLQARSASECVRAFWVDSLTRLRFGLVGSLVCHSSENRCRAAGGWGRMPNVTRRNVEDISYLLPPGEGGRRPDEGHSRWLHHGACDLRRAGLTKEKTLRPTLRSVVPQRPPSAATRHLLPGEKPKNPVRDARLP